MGPLINENKQQLDKKGKNIQNYVILVFFRKKFISKDKAINYNIKNLNRLKRKPLRTAINQKMSYVYKKNVKYDKNRKFIYFFCEKPVWKPVKS